MAKYVLKNRNRAKSWAKSNPSRAKKRFLEWKIKNVERLKLVSKIYRDANRKRLYIKNKEWKISHPNYMRLRSNYDSIRNRCNSPKNPKYKWYGRKGVKCLLSFRDYFNLVNDPKYKHVKKPSIDRIDSSGDYSLKNCRIIERSENSRRMVIEHGGIHPNRWEKRNYKKTFANSTY